MQGRFASMLDGTPLANEMRGLVTNQAHFVHLHIYDMLATTSLTKVIFNSRFMDFLVSNLWSNTFECASLQTNYRISCAAITKSQGLLQFGNISFRTSRQTLPELKPWSRPNIHFRCAIVLILAIPRVPGVDHFVPQLLPRVFT